MDIKRSDIEVQATENYNVERVRRCLNYELVGLGVWGWGLILVPWSYVMFLAAVAAVAFTPLLITALVQEKRYGWLASFFILVIIPPLVVYLTIGDLTWTWVASLTAFAFFYSYCCLLRLAIAEW